MKKNKLFTLLVLLAFGQTSWAQFGGGSGSGTDPYIISETAHWNTLATNVNNGTTTYSGTHFKMMADIEVSETISSGDPTRMVGTSKSNSFQGVFDGNGHTLTVNYIDNGDKDYCAPFRFVFNATIKNLNVAGYIYKNSHKHAASIVGQSYGVTRLTSCRSSVDILSNTGGDGSHGGLVGDVRNDGSITEDKIFLDNCLFDGKMRTNNSRTNSWGGLIGWVTSDHDNYYDELHGSSIVSQEPPHAYISNCLFAPTEVSSYIVNDGDSKTIGRGDSGRYTMTRCCYNTRIGGAQGTNTSEYDNERLCSALRGGWEIFNDVVTPITIKHELTGNGTQEAPYVINTVADWHALATNVYLQENYSGKYFLLNADISTSRMVGDSQYATFLGTFDGAGHTLTFNREHPDCNDDYCAPFRYVKYSTIKDLHVDGTINTASKFAAGIVASVNYDAYLSDQNGVTLRNCRSGVTINSTHSGDGTHGGFIANTNNAPYNFIEGCLFDGKMLGSNTTNCAGFVGWNNDEDGAPQYFVIITNSLFAPTELTIGGDGSKTFVRYSFEVDPSVVNKRVYVLNSYYTQPLGDAQGKLRRSIAGNAENSVVVENNDEPIVYSVSGITGYYHFETIASGAQGHGTGIMFDGVLYAGQDDEMPLRLSCTPPADQACVGYTPSAGTLDGTENPYTLTMPNEDVVISANLISKPWEGSGTENDPYLIEFPNQLDLLATRVNEGNSYSDTYFKVVNDLAYSYTGETNENNYISIGWKRSDIDIAPFKGHFDGGNHTISGIRIYKNGEDYSDSFQGLFGYIEGPAEIKNVILDDVGITGYCYIGGVVGFINGNTTVTNCHVTNSVYIYAVQDNAWRHGGIVGANDYGIVSHCSSAATLTSTGTQYSQCFGGIAGESRGTLTNNYVYDAVIPTVGAGTEGAILGDNWNGTISNNYYHNTSVFGSYSNIGCEHADVTENDGAVRGYFLTLGEHVTSDAMSITIPAHGSTPEATYILARNTRLVTLGYDIEEHGFNVTYFVDGEAIEGNTFTMPARNVNVTATATVSEWDGDGSSWETAYEIYNPSQLDLLATRVNEGNSYSNTYFKLMNDLSYAYTGEANENNYTPVGTLYPNIFQGHFDGQGYTISGIRIYYDGSNSNACLGIFGVLGQDGEVKNLTLTNADITGYQFVGGIVGHNSGYASTITNCHVTASVIIRAVSDNAHYHGGIAGRNYWGRNTIISNCTSAATLIGTERCSYYGGIVGSNDGATVIDNLVIGAVVPAANPYGAIAGDNIHHSDAADGILTRNYYANCTVAGNENTTNVGCNNANITANDGAVPGNVRTVESYGTSTHGGYVFIASPVEEVDPADVTDMLSNSYDLYYFDQAGDANGNEWINYKDTDNGGGYSLTNGKGYLYANSENVTLTFDGTYNLNEEETVDLVYEENARFKGYNLMGNPFPRAAYVNMPFYIMNDDGTGIMAVSEYQNTAISPCVGIMVQATGANQSVTFSTTAPQQNNAVNNGRLYIALTQADPVRGASMGSVASLLDNAIVSFNEGEQLGKFYFGESEANISLQQGSDEYAIAYSDKVGEQPLNFKAKENGNYTLSIDAENVEMSYLHLIDNTIGADVDLLTTPSYSFKAKTTDRAGRFKLVFSTNCEDGLSTNSGTFAYISNGQIIITGANANTTVQVVDMTGRILVSHKGDTNHRISTSGMTPGLYVLRLVNADDVKTQKIVVE